MKSIFCFNFWVFLLGPFRDLLLSPEISHKKPASASIECYSFIVGAGTEQALAAEVLAILCVQLGGSGDDEAIYTQLKPYLVTHILDTSSSIIARAKVSFSIRPNFVFFSCFFVWARSTLSVSWTP